MDRNENFVCIDEEGMIVALYNTNYDYSKDEGYERVEGEVFRRIQSSVSQSKGVKKVGDSFVVSHEKRPSRYHKMNDDGSWTLPKEMEEKYFIECMDERTSNIDRFADAAMLKAKNGKSDSEISTWPILYTAAKSHVAGTESPFENDLMHTEKEVKGLESLDETIKRTIEQYEDYLQTISNIKRIQKQTKLKIQEAKDLESMDRIASDGELQLKFPYLQKKVKVCQS